MIRVMLVDDQASARMGLSMMVGRDPGLSVVATADDGGAALAELARRKGTGEPLPDVVVSDVRMPGTGGVALAREVASRFPSVRTLLLTTYDRDDYAPPARPGSCSRTPPPANCAGPSARSPPATPCSHPA